MAPVMSDFPFKVSARTIVIIRDVPAHQCDVCPEYHFSSDVMKRIEEQLPSVTGSAELAVIRYAA